VTEEYFDKFFCCTRISSVRARIHSLQINIFGLERISTLPEKYLRQWKINILSAEKYLLPAKMFTEDISFVQEEISSVREQNHTHKRKYSPPTED
jgi:hypothetical protein